MALLQRLYDRVLHWSAHRHARWYLALLSFAEASFFPIPPDVMLAPMALAKRHQAWFFAAIATAASTLGGVLGYLIGQFAFDIVHPLIQDLGYEQAYLQTRVWFDHWGVWIVFIAGFSPIPYKVFTISAGVASMALLPFILASTVGRGLRFFMVAGLIYLGGEKMQRILRDYIDRIGWLVIFALVVIYFLVRG